ncbi:hypothetical protein PLESTB_001816800 [Pleodorina starrii]|uniref:Uncharacterized protein n=1 Tax=Pleodorina starrii TaxID=330485 RepID=A0A9W6C116_9CHLO|nr:hypothetical protein PLESTM_001402900 [Pleodorina starrii]GLC61907.1 hypothetical protein PLESTB_001816800 [Pleodorina starrii]GLC75893.1 hypothetical protein PLESTF_001703300 [Pleodorina starrii]
MAETLAKATEALIAAALKDSSGQLSAAAREAVSELRSIHGATDKLRNVETSVLQKLDQVQANFLLAIAGQTRTLSLQAALPRAETDTFDYFCTTTNATCGSGQLVRGVLRNAMRGLPTSLPLDAAYDDGAGPKDHEGRPTRHAEGFRLKLAEHLHAMTGIKPVVEPDADGKSHLIRL